MKNPYKTGITLLVIAGIALVVGIVLFFFNVISALLCVGIAACLGWSGYSILASYVRNVNTHLQAERSEREAMETDESADALALPHKLTLDGQSYSLRYSYSHVDVACPLSQEYASAGDWVTLELEPENLHDADAVRLVLDNGRTLGYLYKGKLQSMAGDFLRKRYPVVGLVESDSASSILLGFYKED